VWVSEPVWAFLRREEYLGPTAILTSNLSACRPENRTWHLGVSERKREEATGAGENCVMRRFMVFQSKLS